MSVIKRKIKISGLLVPNAVPAGLHWTVLVQLSQLRIISSSLCWQNTGTCIRILQRPMWNCKVLKTLNKIYLTGMFLSFNKLAFLLPVNLQTWTVTCAQRVQGEISVSWQSQRRLQYPACLGTTTGPTTVGSGQRQGRQLLVFTWVSLSARHGIDSSSSALSCKRLHYSYNSYWGLSNSVEFSFSFLSF
jgi:hypothetical protein